MLKKTFLVVLFAVLVSGLLIAGINFNVTKAGDYGSSGTSVGGIIWENTTWTLENSPYIITDTVQIPENVTLTIQPGVTVTKPTAGDMFLLNGVIYAHGTADDNIIFDGGDNSIFFNTGGSDASTFLDLAYTVIRNGSNFWTSHGYYGSFSLKHSEIINVAESSVIYPKKDVYIEYNRFINSRGFSTATRDANVYIRYNLFKGNPRWIIVRNYASYDESETIVKYNSFIDMEGIVLELPAGYGSAAMTATENYWATNDTEVIDSMIYDRNDDITCAGFIEYLPILTEPHPDTPTLPIMVNFTCSPSTLYANVTATFDASASFGPYSTIVNYTWDFGDENITTLNNPIAKHTYTMPGNYNVTLTITDEFGFGNNTTKSFTVLQDYMPPITSDDYDEAWHASDFTITLTAIDNESGVAETYYRINDGPIRAVSTYGQPRITTESANNTLEYWSVDKASNEELPHKILTGIKLDKTVPTIGTPSRTPEGHVEPDQEVKILVNVTDFMSGVKNVTLSYNLNDSTVWINLPMVFNSTTGLYETTIKIQQANTLVKYKITAYDNAENFRVEDNNGTYYAYTVIPEFPSTMILSLFVLTTLIATVLLKKKRKTKL